MSLLSQLFLGNFLTVSSGGDPYFSDVEILLHMDGSDGGTTFTDSSSNNSTSTVIGTVATSTTKFKFGTASLRTGTSPNNSRLQTYPIALNYTQGWTLEFWINFDSLGSNQYFLGQKYVAGQPFFWLYLTPTGQLSLYTFGLETPGSQTIAATTWNHIAIVYTSQSDIKLYVNGVLDITSGGWTSVPSIAMTWDIGALDTNLIGSVSSPRVYIDDFRITNNVRRYTSNFTPPTGPFPNS